MIYTDPVQILRQMLFYILISIVVAGIFNGCWYLFFSNWRHMI